MSVISFSFIVLCIVMLGGFYLLPQKLKWLWIMVINTVFYLCAGTVQIFYLLATAVISWLGCRLLSKIHKEETLYLKEQKSKITRDEKKAIKKKYEKKRKRILIIILFLILGQLVFTKYNGFVLQNINFIFNKNYAVSGILMPLGISFYTIFCIGYCIDVYRGQYDAETNILKHFTILSYFPCITQGPIERYDHLQEQIFAEHHFEWKKIVFGVELMLWGFFKKMVIADNLSIATNAIFCGEPGKYNGIYIFLAAFLYAIQLYADFSGYVDIVSGFSQTLGITLVQNFDAPYFSKNIAEYWRRWHMSLGNWFKDYVFYPVLRSGWCQAFSKKCSKHFSRTTTVNTTTTIGLFINWTIVGLWHGASWQYVIYGLYYGFIMIFSMWMEPVYKKFKKRLHIKTECLSYNLFQGLRTLLIVIFGYILFCAQGFMDFVRLVKEMLSTFNIWIIFDGGIFTMGIDQKSAFVLMTAIVILFIVDLLHVKGYSLREEIEKQNLCFRWLLLYGVIFAILIFGVYGPGYNASDFIYKGF